MKTALVFSAGGMFGAWQAGAWKVLAPHFKADLVVGASIGSLNGWAIAGGCPPEELENYWRELSGGGSLKLRFPRSPFDGWFDTRHLQQTIHHLYQRYQPRQDYALVITDLLRLRPRIITGDCVTLQHLLASCALPFVLPQPRIDGRLYTDGGLLNALPVWAALELGAERILALNAMPRLPFAPIRMASRALRAMSGWRGSGPTTSAGAEVLKIVPGAPLGTVREMIDWKRDRVTGWIRRGEEDALAALASNKTFFQELF